MLRLCLLCCILASFCPVDAQAPPSRDASETKETDIRLPNGTLQSDVILKDEYSRSLKDAQQLVDLSLALKSDIEKSGSSVLSLSALHKTEEIEKLSRRIRSRIRH